MKSEALNRNPRVILRRVENVQKITTNLDLLNSSTPSIESSTNVNLSKDISNILSIQEIEYIIGITNNEPSTINEITSETKKLEPVKTTVEQENTKEKLDPIKTKMEQENTKENLKSVNNMEYRIEKNKKKPPKEIAFS